MTEIGEDRQVAVAFTVSCRRPEYLQRALESWASARGQVVALFFLEPEPASFWPGFRAWASELFPRTRFIPSSQPLGCLRNTYRALAWSFSQGAQFVVLAEEDLEVSSDIVEYFAWCRDEYCLDPEVAAICAHARSSKGGEPSWVTRTSWFNQLCWGTWPDRWADFIASTWGPVPVWPEGWDGNLRDQITSRRLQSVFPARSRVLHFGEQSTLNSRQLGGRFTPGFAEKWYRAALSDCYSADYAAQDYREVPFVDVPGLLVLRRGYGYSRR